MQPIYRFEPAGRVHVFDPRDIPWQDTPEPGLRLKPVRYDDERGFYLGLVGFAPMARSGLHQHRGVATSFVLDGGLTDHHGSVGLHEAGINLCGATHDAVAWRDTLLVSRLEGPVVYPRERGALSGLHAGSRHGAVANPAPEVPPEINVAVDALPRHETGIPGVRRQTVFDYAGTGSAHRFVQITWLPGAACPAWRAGALTEFWVRGGGLEVDGRNAPAGAFVIAEPGALLRLASPHGALLLAWAEGPEQWADGAAAHGDHALRTSLFGF